LELSMEASDAFMFAGHKQVYHSIIQWIKIVCYVWLSVGTWVTLIGVYLYILHHLQY
jgi:hypothetical protein